MLLRIFLDTIEPADLPRTEAAFEQLDSGAASLFTQAQQTAGQVAAILRSYQAVILALEGAPSGYEESVADIRDWLSRLIGTHWLVRHWTESLAVLAIDMQSVETRVTRMLGGPPVKDLSKLERFWRAFGDGVTPAECVCGSAHPAAEALAGRGRESLLRIEHFTPEYRRRLDCR